MNFGTDLKPKIIFKMSNDVFKLGEDVEKEINKALIVQRFYNPYDVFTHPPEFYKCDDERYSVKIHIVKWNTKSTRMTVLYARMTEDCKWVFAKKTGQRRLPHGEKMR